MTGHPQTFGAELKQTQQDLIALRHRAEGAEEALRVIATQSIYEWSETRSQLHDLIDAMREVASAALTAIKALEAP